MGDGGPADRPEQGPSHPPVHLTMGLNIRRSSDAPAVECGHVVLHRDNITFGERKPLMFTTLRYRLLSLLLALATVAAIIGAPDVLPTQ